MNKGEIITVLQELYKISGFRISLHGADYREIAAYPEERHPFCKKINENDAEHKMCVECDRIACITAIQKKKTHIHKCRHGLTEAVSPLYNFGALTGFLMMGQIGESRADIERARKNLTRLSGDEGLAREVAEKIPIVESDMVRSYVKILTICAEYLTLSNAIPGERLTVAERAKKYISENIDKKISISDICAALDCSKSTLLNSFKKQYGTTVNSYITELRLEKAIHMLSEGRKTICEIASETGFSDQSYFSKVFSSRFGISPLEYSKKSH